MRFFRKFFKGKPEKGPEPLELTTLLPLVKEELFLQRRERQAEEWAKKREEERLSGPHLVVEPGDTAIRSHVTIPHFFDPLEEDEFTWKPPAGKDI